MLIHHQSSLQPQSTTKPMGQELKKDPSIERWAAMREHTHFYYRFNRAKLLPTLILLGVIPAGIAYLSLKGFDWNESLRGTIRMKMSGRD